MVFSSTTFLLACLPLVAILYYICPRKLRNGLLLVFSLLFYGWGEPKYILIMLFSTVFDYTNARLIGHFQDAGRDKAAKTVLIVDLVGNLGILGFFKKKGNELDNLKTKYNKAETNVENIQSMLEGHQVQLLKDIAMLE